MSEKRKPRVPRRELLAFFLLMVVLQAAGGLFFPNAWLGARGVLQVFGISALCTPVYFVLMWVLRSSERP